MLFWNKFGINLRVMNSKHQCHVKVPRIVGHYDDALWRVTRMDETLAMLTAQ